MRKNDVIELDIESISNLGYGVGRVPVGSGQGGMVVFVPGTVGGDRARVKIIKTTKSYCVARLEELISLSPDRAAAPFCTAPATCGGCVYRHLDYRRELELKREGVEMEFRKAGLADVVVSPVSFVTDGDGAPKTSGYRNKAQYRFTKTKNGIRAGFYANGTHRVAGFEEQCSLHPRIFCDITRTFCGIADRRGLTVYDEESGRGLLRHLYLRHGAGSGEVEVTIVINGNDMPHADEIVEELCRAHSEICGVILNINRGNTNVITGREYRTVRGRPYLYDNFCGLELEVSPAAFYQVNHDAAELLCRTAAGLLGDAEKGMRLLDLYCGIGTIGLSMSDRCTELCGVEIVPESVECAKRNAARNGVQNARFVCADSARGADDMLFAAGYTPDVVVLDPPRKGCSPELIESLDRAGIKKILYISCNPATLARDAAELCRRGYAIGTAYPVDLFPRTGHVETVVLLSKGEVDSKKVRVEFSLEDMDMSDFQDSATYTQIKDYVLEHSGLKVSNLYISQIKRKCEIEVGKNYNLPKSEDSRQPQCPPEKEKAIKDAFEYFGLI